MKRRRIGDLLKLLRTAARMTAKDAARLAGVDATRLGRIEQGRYKVTSAQVKALLDAYGVSDEVTRDALCKATGESPRAGWWHQYREELTEPYLDYTALESEAVTIQAQHPVVIPGLVQCASYVRGTLQQSIHPPTRARADALFAVRMTRQQILTRPVNPTKLHVVIPEAAFFAQFEAGPSVMRDQLRHLITLSEQGNITVQVLALESPPNFGLHQAANLLTFDAPWPSVLHFDNWRGGTLSNDQEEIEAMKQHFDQLSKVALPVEKSRDLMEERLRKGTK
ncbi:helix-turn-helix domain-containing protein [Streptomyces sp. RGM 3693]|uniref:helix-turn-helix domain-containing protein n=1 Tax=Streptomyces sp. RGM 3693 TaxID=3413284 RepID=UPI003D281F97